jgi:Protein of unknown function (DUF3710)
VFRRRRSEGKHAAGREPAETDYARDDDNLGYEDESGDELEYAEDPPVDGEFQSGDLADADENDEDEELVDERDSDNGDIPGGKRRSPRADDLGDPATWTRLRDYSAADQEHTLTGPWDSASGYPEGERIDFGSVLVPVRDGLDVQVLVSEEEGVTVAVVHGDSGLQVQPFAAPRNSGLWAEVRPEIAEEVAKAGGESREQDGPFGPELLARVTPQPPSDPPLPPQPLRFMGVDGPRWFLRGLISGPAATDRRVAGPLEDVFGDIVVVRGDHAEPPRKPLEIQLPEEARQALEGQLADQNQGMPNPFERGPEITETR